MKQTKSIAAWSSLSKYIAELQQPNNFAEYQLKQEVPAHWTSTHCRLVEQQIAMFKCEDAFKTGRDVVQNSSNIENGQFLLHSTCQAMIMK